MGPEFAYRSVMTLAQKAAISFRSLPAFVTPGRLGWPLKGVIVQKKKGKSKGKGKSSAMLVTLQPDAAGVDIGAEEIYVAVPPDRDENPVRSLRLQGFQS